MRKAWVEKAGEGDSGTAVFNTKRELVYHGGSTSLSDFGKARRAATTHELADAIEAASKGVSPRRVGGRDWMFHRGPEMKRPAQAVGNGCLVLRVDGWRSLRSNSAPLPQTRAVRRIQRSPSIETSRPFFFNIARTVIARRSRSLPAAHYKDAKANAKQMAAVTHPDLCRPGCRNRRVQVCKMNFASRTDKSE